MSANPTTSSVREWEQAFLRKAWWLFPLGGVLASLAVGGPFWAWVEGKWMGPNWAQLAGVRAALWALAFAAIPAVWRIGLRIKRPFGWIWLAVAGTVLAAECLLATPRVQAALWLAARARLEGRQHFMREVCYVRLEEAAGRTAAGPAVVLVGSSQVLLGVDEHLLAAEQSLPVIRRAMFGMTPLRALSMRAYVPFRNQDRCVQYLSEFDFTNHDEFPFEWFRPYASWRTVPDVLRCVSGRVKLLRWRQVVDYALAATTEWWRARDFLRQIAFHFSGGERTEATEKAPPDLAAAAAKARGPLNFRAGEIAGFRQFARRLSEQGVELIVFEGGVNPAIDSEDRRQAKRETREMVAHFLAGGYGRYVPLEEQVLDLGPGDWFDMNHLGPTGREKLTRRIAQELSTP